MRPIPIVVAPRRFGMPLRFVRFKSRRGDNRESDAVMVTLTGIKDEVKEAVSEDAVDVLTGETGTGTVDVPAGLYYRVTTYTAIGTAVEEVPATGQSDGTGVSVDKPGTTQGFIKVELATKPLN